MDSLKIRYKFSANVWQYSGQSNWYFVSIPIVLASEIRQNFKWQEEGWGRMKVKVKIGETDWESAIWYDKKQGTYLLPLKKVIRIKEQIDVGKIITVNLFL